MFRASRKICLESFTNFLYRQHVLLSARTIRGSGSLLACIGRKWRCTICEFLRSWKPHEGCYYGLKPVLMKIFMFHEPRLNSRPDQNEKTLSIFHRKATRKPGNSCSLFCIIPTCIGSFVATSKQYLEFFVFSARRRCQCYNCVFHGNIIENRYPKARAVHSAFTFNLCMRRVCNEHAQARS